MHFFLVYRFLDLRYYHHLRKEKIHTSVVFPFEVSVDASRSNEASIDSAISNVQASITLRDIQLAKRFASIWQPHLQRISAHLSSLQNESIPQLPSDTSIRQALVLTLSEVKFCLIDDISPYPVPTPLLSLNLRKLSEFLISH